MKSTPPPKTYDLANSPDEIESRTILETLRRRKEQRGPGRSTNSIMTKPYGAYRHDDDPDVVYVWACADAPGGRLSAIRVNGSRSPPWA
jgi:hypothetical protein